jgi:hypothetical protein
VDAHLYVQFSSLPQVLSHFSARDFIPGFVKLRRFARWAGLDISVKKDEVMLSGFTMPMNPDFLNLFKSQEAENLILLLCYLRLQLPMLHLALATLHPLLINTITICRQRLRNLPSHAS